jgi:hypothetical protein
MPLIENGRCSLLLLRSENPFTAFVTIRYLSKFQPSLLTRMTASNTFIRCLQSLLMSSMVMGWMMSNHHQQLNRRPITMALRSGSFFEEEFEFECPKEDECELDWSKMPESEAKNAVQPSDTAKPEDVDCEDEDECEIDWDAMPGFEEEEFKEEPQMASTRTFGFQAQKSMNKGRVRLEMNWQIDECQTDEDSCEGFCQECAGSGTMACRFCRGTNVVAYGKEYRTCVICAEGKEACSSCRGTGKIAPWTTTYLDGHNKSPQ